MFAVFFEFLSALETFFWTNVAFVLIMGMGVYFTLRMRFLQIRSLPSLFKLFYKLLGSSSKENARGIHPLKVFFASVGGMIGIGNIVGIVTALKIGGPGALFWIWVAGLFGSIIKYAEVYLGLKYRVPNGRGGYDGGPLHFLKIAFGGSWAPTAVAILLCIYGVEIYQFGVIASCLSVSWAVPKLLIVVSLLVAVLLASLGGVRRIATIGSFFMPFFVLTYIAMGLWVIAHEIHQLPVIFASIFKSAFGLKEIVGGAVGGGFWLAMQHGTARACYSSDIGVGYDSIIQSESSIVLPERQASLAILGVFIDNFICTISVLVALFSGIWLDASIDASQLVQTALALYFPGMQLFMPVFLAIAGYTTIIAYFCVGLKCAKFLSPRFGEKVYAVYAVFAFVFFSFFEPSQTILVMSVAQALLLVLNLIGIFRLREEIVLIPAALRE